MVIELVMQFTDEVEGEDPREITYTLSAPNGFEVTGGQMFVENPNTKELDRFAFRIDRDPSGTASVTVLEEP